MNILAISPVNPQKVQFTSNNERRSNFNSSVTVKDLYEMEDRIAEKQSELIKQQNAMIGQTLKSMIELINYLSPVVADGVYDKAMDDAALLKLNVNA